MTNIATSFTIHAVPKRAMADGETLEITFSDSVYPRVIIHTGEWALTDALVAAINGVLAAHKAEERVT